MPFRTPLRSLVSTCVTVLVLAGPALSESDKPKAGSADDALIGSRTDKPDGSTALSFGRRLPTDWDTKVGVDVGYAAAPSTTPTTEYFLDGPRAHDRSSGVGWATIAVPAAPIGWDRAAVEARVDPDQDQGKVSTTLSRSVPLTADSRVTVKNGYSITETLANPTPNADPLAASPNATLATENAVSLDILPSATSFSAGAKLSTTDDRWLRSLSAEQKLFGGPLSVTGSVNERSDGAYEGNLKAGFKKAW